MSVWWVGVDWCGRECMLVVIGQSTLSPLIKAKTLEQDFSINQQILLPQIAGSFLQQERNKAASANLR